MTNQFTRFPPHKEATQGRSGINDLDHMRLDPAHMARPTGSLWRYRTWTLLSLLVECLGLAAIVVMIWGFMLLAYGFGY